MSTFKLRPDKVRHLAEIKTLDEIHKKIVSDFQRRKELLPKKKLKLERLRRQLDNIQNGDASSYTNDDIKLRSKIKSEITELEDEIADIENNVSGADYYSKTEEFIMDYYEMTDNDDLQFYDENPELSEIKQETEKDEDEKLDKLDLLNILSKEKRKHKKVTKKRKRRNVENTTNNILSYLENSGNVITTAVMTTTTTTTTTEITIETKVEDNKIRDRSTLLDQFRMLVDNEYICEKSKNYNPFRKCSECNEDKILIQAEGIYVCKFCGEVEMIIIEAERPNYKEIVAEKPG